MKRLLSLAVTLAILWLLLSGYYTALLLGFGIGSVLLVLWVAARMDVVDAEGQPVYVSASAMLYWAYLVTEIIKANIDVARRILGPASAIDPRVITVKASQKTVVGLVTYANSITLTPGTVSMDVKNDEITVHALTADGAKALMAGEMDRRVTRMEGSD